MIALAFKMLVGNRASCIGVIFGIFLATLLISQQSAIFLGLTARSYRFVTDTPAPNIWIIDPVTESEDKLRMLSVGDLDFIRSTPGIEWAVPFSSSRMPIITPSGKFDVCQLYGIDDATMIGAPSDMIEGNLRDLRRKGAVIVDINSARDILYTEAADGTKTPLTIGDTLEMNGRKAVVVGLCKITQGYLPQPIIYTTYSQAQSFDPSLLDRTSFILAKTKPTVDIDKVIAKINAHTGLQALTRPEIENKVAEFFLKTGILINFGLSVALGIIIGFSISGQIFYLMTLENIHYYALIKAVGGTKNMLWQMILTQAAIVGIIGFTLGIGATVLWGLAIENTSLAFLFPWQLLVFVGVIVLIICIFTVTLSLRKVWGVDPKVLMGN